MEFTASRHHRVITYIQGAEASPARAFYERMKAQYAGSVTIAEDRVTLRSPDQPASVYDFTDAARTPIQR